MEINISIGDRLREERDALGKTQSDLAALAASMGVPGATRQSQAKYEKGLASPSAAYMAAMATAGIDVLYVLTGQRDGAATQTVDPAEQVLLNSYRLCKPDAKANLIQTAALLSAGLAPAASPKSSAKSVPSSVKVGNLTSSHDGVVQVGYAGGKVSVKK
ncbi:helix-turn-helix domain-containing protein [Comamonas testosteroni]|uniref:helix-turn-helix domain-containing protein n=1 Tax=Comamonas testosteroni TaxID=285 RepID=UPI0026F218A0|nr:helix-turn-helix transcriptional regulator [Comamonas testosteroni]